MLHVVEHQIIRYNAKEDANWNHGEVVWSRVFVVDSDIERKHRAVQRLLSWFRSQESDLHRYTPSDRLTLYRVKRSADFNDMGEAILTRTIGRLTSSEKRKKLRAAKRLSQCLSSKDHENWYAANIAYVQEGTYGYAHTTRSTHVLSVSDRQRVIRQKIRGRKAAITRSINKAKAVREAYRTSLYPDAYRSDPKYVQLMRYLPQQRKRLREAKQMTIDDIDTVEGRVHLLSRPSLDALLIESKM